MVRPVRDVFISRTEFPAPVVAVLAQTDTIETLRDGTSANHHHGVQEVMAPTNYI